MYVLITSAQADIVVRFDGRPRYEIPTWCERALNRHRVMTAGKHARKSRSHGGVISPDWVTGARAQRMLAACADLPIEPDDLLPGLPASAQVIAELEATHAARIRVDGPWGTEADRGAWGTGVVGTASVWAQPTVGMDIFLDSRWSLRARSSSDLSGVWSVHFVGSSVTTTPWGSAIPAGPLSGGWGEPYQSEEASTRLALGAAIGLGFETSLLSQSGGLWLREEGLAELVGSKGTGEYSEMTLLSYVLRSTVLLGMARLGNSNFAMASHLDLGWTWAFDSAPKYGDDGDRAFAGSGPRVTLGVGVEWRP